MTELSRARLRATLYTAGALVRERRIAGQPVPREVVDLLAWADQEWRQPSPTRQEAVAVAVALDETVRRVGTTTAARMLGWTTRRVQRHADMLGGQKIAGRLVFRVNDLRDYATSKRLTLKEIR